MIAALCVDDSGGLMFNRRRQSQDRALRADLLREAGGRRLWMSAYSRRQFGGGAEISVDEDFLTLAKAGELCFVEGAPLLPHIARLEGLILYRWNRRYPADVYMDIDLSAFRLCSREEFPGHSHEIITKEVYCL